MKLSTMIAVSSTAMSSALPFAIDARANAVITWPTFPNSTTGHIKTDGRGNVVFHEVLASDGNHVDLVKRDTPHVCTWGGSHADYYYHYFNDAGALVPGKTGTLCVGWDQGVTGSCPKPWGSLAQDNIKKSMSVQIQKDGRFKSTQVGEWLALWNSDLTTAFHDSTSKVWEVAFNRVFHNFDNANRSRTYYYARAPHPDQNGPDYAQTAHGPYTCP